VSSSRVSSSFSSTYPIMAAGAIVFDDAALE
jgi:hypothetical protein